MEFHNKRLIIVTGLTLVVLAIVLGVFGAKYFGLINNSSPSVSDKAISNNSQAVAIKYETFIENLEVPWSIVFTDPNRILITERAGKIRVVQDGKLQSEPIFTFPEVQSTGEEGLMGMVLDPNYLENRYLYVCYAYPFDNLLKDRVVKLKDQGNSMTIVQTVIEGIPAGVFHAGCQLNIGPDEKLYISTGDAGQKELAQDKDSLAGKILRINLDGTIPDDNPFGNAVWSTGHRNPQGFDWYPGSDVLFSSEHGPTIFDGPAGGDEINVIEKGGNYGWPEVHHQQEKEGYITPKIVFTPAIAPAAGIFYQGDLIPQFINIFIVGMLKGEGLLLVKLDEKNPKVVEGYEEIKLQFGRIRAITEGPDGAIYFTTSNRDGRGKVKTGDDKIIKLSPEN